MLNGARFAQVGWDGALVGPLFAFAGQLTEQYHGNAQFLGQQLATATNAADLLGPVATLPIQQLQVVDHQQVQSVAHFVATGQGTDAAD
ncbi:hypothetical protein D3C76_1373900 [compost metagenome]